MLEAAKAKDLQKSQELHSSIQSNNASSYSQANFEMRMANSVLSKPVSLLKGKYLKTTGTKNGYPWLARGTSLMPHLTMIYPTFQLMKVA